MESFEELGRWDVVEGVVSYVKTMGEKEEILLYVAHQSEQEANDFLSSLSLSESFLFSERNSLSLSLFLTKLFLSSQFLTRPITRHRMPITESK